MRELARSIARENMRRAGIKRPNKCMSHGRWRAYVRWTPNTSPRMRRNVAFFSKIRKRVAAAKVARRTRKNQRKRAA